MTSVDAITIRRATVDDAEGILECLRSAFEPYERFYPAAGYEDSVLTRETLPRRLNEMAVFVALDHSGSVVGTIACSTIGHAEGHLRGMAVRPDCQARGIADQLLERAEAELIKQNCSRITLDTTEPLQRAMRFYEGHGFRRSGTVRDFFGMPLIEYFKELAENS
jgi:ribosomal protein S18 acetylase RimI-like enzyme